MRFHRFLWHLYFPPHDETWFDARLQGRADVKWQPYLFTAAFWGALITILVGDPYVIPPGDNFGVFDVTWIVTALLAPISAISAAWTIRKHKGRRRYFALWLRLASNLALVTSILSYQMERIFFKEGHPFEDTILFGSSVFLMVLIVGDIRFLVFTEKLSHAILRREADVSVLRREVDVSK